MTRAEFADKSQGSLEIAKDLARNSLAWLDYVPEYEFTPTEKRRFMAVLEHLTIVAGKLNEKYMS
jgi:hypothetical protein